jgi:hypothetical protein
MKTPLRALRAVVVAATFSLAATASAQGAGTDDAMRVGLLGGFEFEDETGFGLRGDLELMPLMTVGTGSLKLLGSVSWTYFSEEAGGIDVTTNVFRFIPGIRLDYPLQDQLGFYGDAGLGLYHARLSVDDVVIPGIGTVEGGDDTETSLLFRFAAGGYYELSPNLRAVAEIGLLPHFGDFDITPFTLFGGVSYAF